MSTTLRGAGVAAVLALVACPAADASIVEYRGRTLHYDASKGEANDLKMQIVKQTKTYRIVIEDRGASVIALSRCHKPEDAVDWHQATCRVPHRTKHIRISLGDRRDEANVVASAGLKPSIEVIGGSARDIIRTFGGRATTLVGEAGNDWLRDADANATLSGGSGADTIVGGGGRDWLTGGGGVDYLYGDSGNDVLDARDIGMFNPYGVKDAIINCGVGEDVVALDPVEPLASAECEYDLADLADIDF